MAYGDLVNRSVRASVAGAALALQFAVLYVPRAPGVAVDGLPLDKLVHVAVFALPTYALIRLGWSRATVGVLMVGQAVVSELTQHLVLAQRSGDPADALADLVGVLIGVALVGRRPAQASTSPSISPVG